MVPRIPLYVGRRFTSNPPCGGFFSSLISANRVTFIRALNPQPLVKTSRLRGPITNDNPPDDIVFPESNRPDFAKIRKNKFFVDKTSYIHELPTSGKVLFCRPKGFGKSLTISMLHYFHAVEHKSSYKKLFGNLDVNNDVKKERLHPGRYIVLDFDFSMIPMWVTPDEAITSFYQYINNRLWRFIKSPVIEHLDLSRDGLNFADPKCAISNFAAIIHSVSSALTKMKEKKNSKYKNVEGVFITIDEYDYYVQDFLYTHPDARKKLWENCKAGEVYSCFFNNIKSLASLSNGIRMVYITGIMPFLFSYPRSTDFDITDLSFRHTYASLCGFTRGDVSQALHLICEDKDKAKNSLTELTYYSNGYHFCEYQRVEPVFNTKTTILALNAIQSGENLETVLSNPSNSEISKQFLNICASSPHAIANIQRGLQHNDNTYECIPYIKFPKNFTLKDMMEIPNEDAWRSFMTYAGGLSFDPEEPSKNLKILNRIVAVRFGKYLLAHLDQKHDVSTALQDLAKNGEVKPVLTIYQHLMERTIDLVSGYRWNEADYRDKLCGTFLQNPGIESLPEYEIVKSTGSPENSGILIKSKDVCVFLALKSFGIADCDLYHWVHDGVPGLSSESFLDFKLRTYPKYDTIRDWVDRELNKQIKEYVEGMYMKDNLGQRKLRAYAVIFIGSQKILFAEYNAGGGWAQNGFQVAEEEFSWI